MAGQLGVLQVSAGATLAELRSSLSCVHGLSAPRSPGTHFWAWVCSCRMGPLPFSSNEQGWLIMEPLPTCPLGRPQPGRSLLTDPCSLCPRPLGEGTCWLPWLLPCHQLSLPQVMGLGLSSIFALCLGHTSSFCKSVVFASASIGLQTFNHR